MTRPVPEGERGMILVNVLMFVAIASGLVLLMINREEVALDRSIRSREAARALAVVRGGELSALSALQRDAQVAPEADYPGEPWGAISENGIAIEGGRFDLTIADAEGRFNVNSVRRELDPIRLDVPGKTYRPDQDAAWHDLALITNRAQGGRPAEYDPVGTLVQGSWDPKDPAYDSMATWQLDPDHDTLRVRLPWSMLGMADPSSRLALGEGVPAKLVEVPGIGFDLDVDGERHRLDFTWPTWNRVEYTTRIKAGADVLAEAYADLAP